MRSHFRVRVLCCLDHRHLHRSKGHLSPITARPIRRRIPIKPALLFSAFDGRAAIYLPSATTYSFHVPSLRPSYTSTHEQMADPAYIRRCSFHTFPKSVSASYLVQFPVRIALPSQTHTLRFEASRQCEGPPSGTRP